jgi:hypothetical protein
MLYKRLYLHKFDNETKLNSYFSVLRDYGISKFSKQISDFLVELINLVKGEYNELDLAVGDLYRDFNKNVESQYADLWNNEPDFALYKVMMKERGLPIDTYDTYLEFMRTLKAYNENPNNVDKQSPYYNVMRFCGELKDKLFEILSIGNNIDEILLQISKVDEVCEKMADEALTVMSAVYKAFSGKVQDIKSACMKEFMLTGNEYVNRTALQEMIDLIDRKTEAQNILDNIKGSIDTNFFGYASSSEGDRIETARKPAYNMCTRGDNLLNGVYSSAGYSKAELIINIKSALKIVNSLNETNDNIQENNIEEFKSYLGILAEQHNPPLQWSLSLKQEADNMNWCYISGETEAMLESVETEIQDAMRL